METFLKEASVLQDENPQKLHLLEQALNSAVTQNDLLKQYDTRLKIVEVASFSGKLEKALMHFGWCVSQHDNDPLIFPLKSLLWKYKYIMSIAPKFHTISLDKINTLEENMERHYRQAGCSIRPVKVTLASSTYFKGEATEGLSLFLQSLGYQRDYYADCVACELNLKVSLLVANAKDEDAVSQSQVLISGVNHCAEVPHLTYSELLPSCTRLGDEQLAQKCLTKGYQLIASNPVYLPQMGMQLQYCALNGLLALGISRFQGHIHWWQDALCHWSLYEFELGAMLLFIAAAAEQEEVTLNLPESFSCYSSTGVYKTQVLADYFKQKLMVNTRGFDQRNGNDFFGVRVAQSQVLLSERTETNNVSIT